MNARRTTQDEGTSQLVPRYDTTTAVTLSIVIPPVGDFYVDRPVAMIFDTLFWPFSVVWAPPINYVKARDERREIEGNVSFDRVTENQTKVRITLNGVSWDIETYPPTIRRLHDEMERQLFLKTGGTVGAVGAAS